MSQYEPFHRAESAQDTPPPPPPPPARLDFYLPATPPLELIHALEHWWWAYRRRRRFRKSMLPLLEYDDAILEDLGYYRDDLLWALRLPLKEDALRALEARQAQRQEVEHGT
ncbi:hypothetical protein HOP52_09575 [Halomonas campisalis]|uniref:DUF1127 domain-containing protein n=1 Tax=Billgrantia campisalis TaxID=74661 RepID=A0ABS9P8A4_9GAMM|nr:hypothetical protein [Halomonas campisalis]MCG6658002.1 hypothetical protein [Halomonas campisalis]MDR5864836.1 hypothetical protein [Halomonas campisalis]